MRVLQLISLLMSLFFISQLTYAFGSCYAKQTCRAPTPVYKDCAPPRTCYTYVASNTCPESMCARYETPCQCSDEGWRYNCCISHCRYCMAFGNIGAR